MGNGLSVQLDHSSLSLKVGQYSLMGSTNKENTKLKTKWNGCAHVKKTDYFIYGGLLPSGGGSHEPFRGFSKKDKANFLKLNCILPKSIQL